MKYIQIQKRTKNKQTNKFQVNLKQLFDDNIRYIYCSYHTKGFSLKVILFPSWASFKISVITDALHPALMIFFPFSDLRCWYIPVITFAWRGFKVDKRRSTLMVATSRASIIQDVKNSLKAYFFNFFKDTFVVKSNGRSKWVIFFGAMIDSIP